MSGKKFAYYKSAPLWTVDNPFCWLYSRPATIGFWFPPTLNSQKVHFQFPPSGTPTLSQSAYLLVLFTRALCLGHEIFVFSLMNANWYIPTFHWLVTTTGHKKIITTDA